MLSAATKRTLTSAVPKAPARVRLIATTSLPSSSPSAVPPSPPPPSHRTSAPKREGNISDAFASLSGLAPAPLPDRYRQIKLSLVAGHEDAVIASWSHLLSTLQTENAIIAAAGPSIIPQIPFSDLDSALDEYASTIRKRGAAVIQGVIPSSEARAWKFDIEAYAARNPSTSGFPPHDPQVLELYWSVPQLIARAHPNLLATQKALMTRLWHTNSDPRAPISLSTPLAYADRLRIRQPGDASFALGAHQDGGSVERWDPEGYGRGGTYDAVFRGEWEAYDPFDAAKRVFVETNLHNGLGACSMYRAFQGWLALSESGPGEGTLKVGPLAREATAYTLLRPFFRPVRTLKEVGGEKERYLEARNWMFTRGEEMTSDLQGASPGHGQDLSEEWHPHLELERTMVSMPKVRPGDFVIWHCDTIHAVDKVHNGKGDSSVLYIPVCPATEPSAGYVVEQRDAFLAGTPGPDFPGGMGESEHIGRPTKEWATSNLNSPGLQTMGLAKIETPEGITPGAAETIRKVNQVLGF